MPSIVTVNVSQQVAPTPSTLQQTGAFISQGATTKTPGTLSLLTQLSDLTPLLTAAAAISSITWAASLVTIATAAPHGYPVGDQFMVTIAGAVPAGYNGTFLATSATTTTFTYSLITDPGAETTGGTWIPASVAELTAMATTFFAQGSSTPVYVLELGPTAVADGVAYLTTWMTANPKTVYSYLVPREWDGNPAFLALIESYESTTGLTYFWVTTTINTYTDYTDLMKCVVALIEAPGIPATEFSIAAAFWVALHYQPSNTNKVAPFAFSYVYGVTPYPTKGNSALLSTLKTAAINVIGTGAEGGISNTIVLWGTTMDGRDFTYWFSTDWTQIQADITLSNTIINGSNNPVNPLYYDQNGINRLQAALAQMMQNAITFGLATGTIAQVELDSPTLNQNIDNQVYTDMAIINAVPFVTYATANPGDYKTGTYKGLSIIYIPARGFTAIVINLVVSDFITV